MNLAFYKQLTQELAQSPAHAKLVAVTKYSDAQEINEAIKNGVSIIGENRVEVAEEKFSHLLPVEKHFIGAIQSKKIKKIVELFDVVESVDSLEHLQKIDVAAGEDRKKIKVFLQFNISEEPQKSGFKKEDAKEILKVIPELKNIAAVGVMGMAENTDDENKIREQFLFAKQIQKALAYKIPAIKELSIGMSQDYTIALQVGATYIRIGSALFKE